MSNSKNDEKMTKEQLIEAIEAAIKTNGQHDITGSSLQAILVEMVNTIYAAMPSAPQPYIPTYKGVEGSLIIQGEGNRGEATTSAIFGEKNMPVLIIDDGKEMSSVRLRGQDKKLYDIYVKSDGSVAAEPYIK